MQKISTSDNAYIRPSPSGGSLGGVARKTLETIVLTEVFVETVGVGQSEILVSEMVDMFVLLAQPGSGDELQGIKKGIMELADMIVVNKSDGALETPAKITTRALLDAMRLIAPKAIEWNPPVVRASAYTGYNLERVYDTINTYFQKINESNRWDDIRKTQQSHWMWREVKNLIFERLHQNKEVKSLAKDLEKGVADGTIAPTIAAYAIFEKFVGSK
ncbi:putative GTPase [Zancudomyces culisetae]|uniref:Putative GTPase n=1 Tax=Zancudomyces culisetae TaxID=1213189 RepID=A0A1R1PQ70_ZANCU|nr:putative GTPase [Zancudomyces culisetae]OMH83110.1 putative GTPase [Zancudomyces culisetae]|eukprot:OMH79454.1 putative GTPase [Zancudomyces culisetae]